MDIVFFSSRSVLVTVQVILDGGVYTEQTAVDFRVSAVPLGYNGWSKVLGGLYDEELKTHGANRTNKYQQM